MTRAGAGDVYMLSKTLTWPGLQPTYCGDATPVSSVVQYLHTARLLDLKL